MAEKVIEIGLAPVEEYYGSEVTLFYPGLYAGSTDLVCSHNGVDAIVDFKQANRPKKKEWIEDYFLQCCAYANAHNVMFDTNIKDLIILMVDRDLMFKEFHITEHEFPFYTDKWKKRLIKYHNNY